MGSFLNDTTCLAGCASTDTPGSGAAGDFLTSKLPDGLGGVVVIAVRGSVGPELGWEFWEIRFEVRFKCGRDTDGEGRGVVGKVLNGLLAALGPEIGRL